MIKKLFKNPSKTITSAALLLGAMSFLSRLLGLLRARIFAYRFGASQELDMYYAAFRIPDLVFAIIIMGAVSSAFIPIFTQARVKSKKENHWYLANNFLHSFSFLVLLLSIFLMIIAPYLVKAIAPGFAPAAQKTTTLLTRIMLLQPIILAVSSIVAGILQSFKMFFAYALSPLMYNVGIIIGAWFLAPRFGIKGLAFGVVLGAIFHLLIQIPSLISCGFRYKFYVRWRDKLMRKIVRLTLPRSLGLATIQFNLIVMTAIASGLSEGSIAIFNYANDIQYVPLGIIGIAFAAAAFPSLSESFAAKKIADFKKTLNKTILETLYLVLPIAILFFVLRYEVTRVLLNTGEFGKVEVGLTSAAIALFCIGIPFQSLVPLLSRAFFALHNTIIPVMINLITVGANIGLALWLVDLPQFVQFFSLQGDTRILALPLAFSLSGIINVLLLSIALKVKLTSFDSGEIFTSILKFTLLSSILLLINLVLKNLLYNVFNVSQIRDNFIVGLLSGSIALAAYFFFSYLLKIKEVKSVFKVIKK